MQRNRLNLPVILALLSGIVVFTGLHPHLQAEDFFEVKNAILDEAWKRVAFFYILPAITLNDLGHTSNIYSYRDREEPDWLAEPGLDLKISTILGNRFIISVTTSPSYRFYANHIEHRAFNNRLQAVLYTYLGRINLKYQFTSNYTVRESTMEFAVPTRWGMKEHHFSLDMGSYENLFITLYLQQSRVKYQDERYLGDYNLKNLLNRQELKAGIKLYKIIFSRTRLFLNYERVGYEFAYETRRNETGDQASLGIEFPEISRIKGSLQLGLKFFNPAHPLYKNYTKTFGTGEVTVTLFSRFKLHFQYLVDNFPAFWRTDQRYNEKSAAAGLEFYVSRRIKLGYSYRLGQFSYENFIDRAKTRQDDFYTSSLYVGIKFFKKVGIGLVYRISHLESGESGFDRRSDFIGGYITHEF
ncbi:MAG: hypothetical protein JSV88_18145 [Candidatus Aminicenantes bacterium]|nr:MAG: hypothetical protein JSV88_18145 [Candidatus Aminicenantes bacterium]